MTGKYERKFVREKLEVRQETKVDDASAVTVTRWFTIPGSLRKFYFRLPRSVRKAFTTFLIKFPAHFSNAQTYKGVGIYTRAYKTHYNHVAIDYKSALLRAFLFPWSCLREMVK